MASSWGSSWGGSWGNSWGAITSTIRRYKIALGEQQDTVLLDTGQDVALGSKLDIVSINQMQDVSLGIRQELSLSAPQDTITLSQRAKV